MLLQKIQGNIDLTFVNLLLRSLHFSVVVAKLSIQSSVEVQ